MIHNPFTREPMISVENGSMADFFQHGGKEEDILKAIRNQNALTLASMKIQDAKHFKFDWPDQNVDHALFEVTVWILRVSDQHGDDDFRWFYSSQGVQEELVLRGWND